MTAQIIDGKALAQQIRDEVAEDVARLVAAGRPRPGLATVLVGENPASKVYVSSKQKACAQVGIESFGYDLPATTSQKELEELVRQLNADARVNGILVQLPLPTGLDEERVLNAIRIEKDVDGFHPVNVGALATGNMRFAPCTPYGCMKLLEKSSVSIEGKHAVVVGRSNIVGKPLAALLMQKAPKANATVTVVHSATRDLAAHTRRADILVAAMGAPKTIRADMVKDGVVVIDVATNRIPDASKKSGYRTVGDVDFEAVREKARAITPVPGGVGPMTIAMLLVNTVRAGELAVEGVGP